MSLFSSIVGQVASSLGSGDATHAGLLEEIGGLVSNSQSGGLQGLIAAFEQKGLGGVVASWVGTGQNLPISAEQLQSVLGSEQVQAIAQRLGLSPEAVSGNLAQLLPQVVDRLTPAGAVPDQGALGGLLGMLKGSLG